MIRFYASMTVVAATILLARPAAAQLAPPAQPSQVQGQAGLEPPGPMQYDPMCGRLRQCAQDLMSKYDDGTSTPAAIADRIAPHCEAEMVSCNDAIVARATAQNAAQSPNTAAQFKAYMADPKNRVAIEKEIVTNILTVEVNLHRAPPQYRRD